jgi:hypothetical protein
MSFNGPILEKWLLSGQATFKNLSVGGGGLTKIAVPPGKTFIVTRIEVLPFLNIIDDVETYYDAETFSKIFEQNLENALKRTQAQLLFFNPRINSVYNLKNEFSLNTFEKNNLTHTAPTINAKKQLFDCFHVVEEDTWLFLKFFSTEENYIASMATDFYQLYFDGSQNWSPTTNYYGYEDQYDTSQIFANNTPPAFNYFPQGYGQPSSVLNGVEQFILPSIPYALDNTQSSSFLPPIPGQSSNPLNMLWIQSMPFYNISVIELNKRLSTEQLL